jgi:hypothetical protein
MCDMLFSFLFRVSNVFYYFKLSVYYAFTFFIVSISCYELYFIHFPEYFFIFTSILCTVHFHKTSYAWFSKSKLLAAIWKL